MARQQIDIQLMDDGDAAIVNGDFGMVESTARHQEQLLLNDKADFKSTPTIAVGMFNYLDDEGPAELIRAMSQQFSQDGMLVNSITTTNGKIVTDAAYQ